MEIALNGIPISDEEKHFITFGVIKPSNESLQLFADQINNNQILINLNKQFRQIRIKGIITILQYAKNCDLEIPGYSLKELLSYPFKKRLELECCFYSLCGVEQIHLFKGKLMVEIPLRHYFRNEKKLLKYVDYWFSCTG